jgi:hypothetical protein
MPINRYVSRRIQSTIYKLKRMYGGPIIVYKQGTPKTDYDTGEMEWIDRSVIRVRLAIILPVKIERTQAQGISIISAGKEFAYGGMYDKGSRWFYIDPRDLPKGYEIKRDDWIVYDGKKYEIESITDNEFDDLWEVKGVELPGVVPAQIHLLSGHTIVGFDDTADGVL